MMVNSRARYHARLYLSALMVHTRHRCVNDRPSLHLKTHGSSCTARKRACSSCSTLAATSFSARSRSASSVDSPSASAACRHADQRSRLGAGRIGTKDVDTTAAPHASAVE